MRTAKTGPKAEASGVGRRVERVRRLLMRRIRLHLQRNSWADLLPDDLNLLSVGRVAANAPAQPDFSLGGGGDFGGAGAGGGWEGAGGVASSHADLIGAAGYLLQRAAPRARAIGEAFKAVGSD